MRSEAASRDADEHADKKLDPTNMVNRALDSRLPWVLKICY
ncbi:MAG TPA: hypothetical protein VJR94_09855 [Candidatus Nitrosocosmicus sp.]|nr:hypothetical protein [Candidatus Nitrosocosmicus sp.]